MHMYSSNFSYLNPLKMEAFFFFEERWEAKIVDKGVILCTDAMLCVF